MFNAIMQNIKLYGIAFIGIVVTFFVVAFKLRGSKIDTLKEEVLVKDIEIKSREKKEKVDDAVHETENAVADVIIKGEAEKQSAPTEVDKMMEDSNTKRVPSGI